MKHVAEARSEFAHRQAASSIVSAT